MAEYKMQPQFICLTCKTVIGPIWDDYDNQCKCTDPYEFEVVRVVLDTEMEKYKTKLIKLLTALEANNIDDLIEKSDEILIAVGMAIAIQGKVSKGYEYEYTKLSENMKQIADWKNNNISEIKAFAKKTLKE